jgi:hypothetical protein
VAAWAVGQPQFLALQASVRPLAERGAQHRVPRMAARQASAELPAEQQWGRGVPATDQAQRAWAPRLPLLAQPVQPRQVQAEQVAQARQRPVREAQEVVRAELPA